MSDLTRQEWIEKRALLRDCLSRRVVIASISSLVEAAMLELFGPCPEPELPKRFDFPLYVNTTSTDKVSTYVASHARNVVTLLIEIEGEENIARLHPDGARALAGALLGHAVWVTEREAS